MLLAPWVLGRQPSEFGELAFVFVMVVAGLALMYLFGRYWQS